MDHSNVDVKVKQEEKKESEFEYQIVENGKIYTVPYRMIKRVTFTNIKKDELVDIPHAARLQYRLMLLEPVIKATVDFTKLKIMVIYNPRTANNNREKMSLEELQEFLVKQGVHTDEKYLEERDYDYKKELYDYAYTPPSIRERAPYGYTMEEWKSMKPEWEKKMVKGEIEKQEKYKKFQESFLEENPEMAAKIDPNYKPAATVKATGFFGRIFGKKQKKEKGFWFHGV
jgi:hypothetical protein